MGSKKVCSSIAISVLIGLSFCGNALATLLEGKTISYQYFYPDLSSPYADAGNGNYLVGPGIEVTNIANGAFYNSQHQYGTIDISDSNIYVDFLLSDSWGLATFSGFRITDSLGLIDAFTSVTINPVTSMLLDQSRITFDSDNIWVNWNGLSFNENTIVSLDINGSSQPVPDPATMLLIGTGIAGIFAARRKKTV